MNRLWLQRGIVAAFSHLLKAHDYALDAGENAWDFAVEIDLLKGAGLNNTDLYWLVKRGLICHGRETTLYGDDRRSFDCRCGIGFSRRSCFLLTDAGLEQARRIGARTSCSHAFGGSVSSLPKRHVIHHTDSKADQCSWRTRVRHRDWRLFSGRMGGRFAFRCRYQDDRRA